MYLDLYCGIVELSQKKNYKLNDAVMQEEQDVQK